MEGNMKKILYLSLIAILGAASADTAEGMASTRRSRSMSPTQRARVARAEQAFENAVKQEETEEAEFKRQQRQRLEEQRQAAEADAAMMAKLRQDKRERSLSAQAKFKDSQLSNTRRARALSLTNPAEEYAQQLTKYRENAPTSRKKGTVLPSQISGRSPSPTPASPRHRLLRARGSQETGKE